jgi:hypothetical protein
MANFVVDSVPLFFADQATDNNLDAQVVRAKNLGGGTSTSWMLLVKYHVTRKKCVLVVGSVKYINSSIPKSPESIVTICSKLIKSHMIAIFFGEITIQLYHRVPAMGFPRYPSP